MPIEVTPKEFREVDIREAWRGYNRDDVDELLDRAAASIEELQSQIAAIQARGSAAPAPPQQAPTPAPSARPAGIDTDAISRTLILAQKAADDAVAEAQAKARRLMEESEARAQAVVSDAEAAARALADTERRRIAADVAQLETTRGQLNADIDSLERFEHTYRERLREAVEADLAFLKEQRPAVGEVRPGLTDVVIPPDTASPARVAAAPSAAPVDHDDATDEGLVVGGLPAAANPTPPQRDASSGWLDLAGPDADERGRGHRVATDTSRTPIPADPTHALDDDAFFASLREAVQDDPITGSSAPFDFEDDPDERRGLSRRGR